MQEVRERASFFFLAALYLWGVIRGRWGTMAWVVVRVVKVFRHTARGI